MYVSMGWITAEKKPEKTGKQRCDSCDREMNHIATDTKNLVPTIPIFVFSLLSHFSLTSRINSNIEELPVVARAHKTKCKGLGKLGTRS